MGTQPRTGFARVGIRRREKPSGSFACPSGKRTYSTDVDALDALRRVSRERQLSPDGRDPENHIYLCRDCGKWHLSSGDVVGGNSLLPERDIRPSEDWEAYARRLERRIAAQRGQIMSMLALGHGGDNRAARKRIGNLTVALGKMTAMWQEEKQNREALSRNLKRRRRRWWRRERT